MVHWEKKSSEDLEVVAKHGRLQRVDGMKCEQGISQVRMNGGEL